MILYTSYFYQIRFFPENLIPLSTAVYDPAWFHAGKGQDYEFKDKRGVMNGVRAPIFVPIMDEVYCGPECKLQPPDCIFLTKYREQLDKLNYDEIMERLQLLHDAICNEQGFDDCDFALIVHEAPWKKCSERIVIQQWFQDRGYNIQEWQK